MNCHRVRRLLPLLDQGGLPPQRLEALETHLHGCSACQQLREEHEEVLGLLSSYQAPPLPEGFDAQLRAGLAAEATRAPTGDTRPLPALNLEPRRWRVVKALSYLAAGMLLGALGLWGALSLVGPAKERPSSASTGSGGLERLGQSHPGHPKGALIPQGDRNDDSQDEASIAATLDLGQVAVVTLVLDAVEPHPEAVLELVLPDGLALVGEGLVKLEEKALRWSEPLVAGENLIRVPVRAQRPGTWTLVARTRSGAQELQSSARLKVTHS